MGGSRVITCDRRLNVPELIILGVFSIYKSKGRLSYLGEWNIKMTKNEF